MTVTIIVPPKTQEVVTEVAMGYRQLRKHRVGLKNALNEIGSEVVSLTAKYIFNGPKTGRVYSFRGGRHQASAPGESPANRAGRLASSGDYKVRSFQEMVVGQTEDYADFLDKGTKHMDPRPVLIRAVRANARNAEQAILEAVREQIS